MSPVTADLVDTVLNVAKYDCNVIIQGETGVGKEKGTGSSPQEQPRKGKPCIKINCATIQESLAESEFFGYEKGSLPALRPPVRKDISRWPTMGHCFWMR